VQEEKRARLPKHHFDEAKVEEQKKKLMEALGRVGGLAQ
jgi:hypothetical protein